MRPQTPPVSPFTHAPLAAIAGWEMRPGSRPSPAAGWRCIGPVRQTRLRAVRPSATSRRGSRVPLLLVSLEPVAVRSDLDGFLHP